MGGGIVPSPLTATEGSWTNRRRLAICETAGGGVDLCCSCVVTLTPPRLVLGESSGSRSTTQDGVLTSWRPSLQVLGMKDDKRTVDTVKSVSHQTFLMRSGLRSNDFLRQKPELGLIVGVQWRTG